MDKDQDQEQDQDRERRRAATRLTEAAVTQLFQGASTPMDVARGQQIGLVVAELYSAIHAGQDVQSTLDGRTSLAERLATLPDRTPVLPRPPRVVPSRAGDRPLEMPAVHQVEKGVSGNDSVDTDAGPAAAGAIFTQPIRDESAGEAQSHQEGTVIPNVAVSRETQQETPQDSLQSLLSEIGADGPEDEIPNEMVAPQLEPPVYGEKLQAEDLESQLASLASEGPVEPETPAFPASAPAPEFTATPLPNPASPRTPSTPPFNTAVLEVEVSENRRRWWRFWKR